MLSLFLSSGAFPQNTETLSPGEWIELCNGTDLTGREGDEGIWQVTDGYISGKASYGPRTCLISHQPCPTHS